VADFDNDGDLDLLLGNSNQPIRLFENLANEYEDRNWITFDLVGTQSNKQAIGANMTLWIDQNKFQVQQKFACSGSFGCSDQRMHFGLGDATKIHSVVVKWPSGETQEWFDIDINQIVILHEKQESKTHGGIIFMVGIVLFLGYILHRKG
ncbi:MAG: ASPIC/UnbV domain-containing protein, partial [Candidatus Thermoplasmatota archaeon]|nr:ASPIC/UnbV domain-containing protein [Candidatus Thermoplasmatota archaeon]